MTPFSRAGWLAALVVALMFFNVFPAAPEPDKISLVRSIALIMIAAWLVKVPMAAMPGCPRPIWPGDEPAGGNWRGFVTNPFIWPIALVIVAISPARSLAWPALSGRLYQRLQEPHSLAYVTIGGLAAATMRSPSQLCRFQHAVIIVSLPIAIYGVIQHAGLDPLPWGGDVQTRGGQRRQRHLPGRVPDHGLLSDAGRVFTSFVRLMGIGKPVNADEQDWQASLTGGAYLFVLLVQAIAHRLDAEPRPWLGWIPGIFLFALLTVCGVRPLFSSLLGVAIGGGLGQPSCSSSLRLTLCLR